MRDGLTLTPPDLDLRRVPRIIGFAPSQLGWNTVCGFLPSSPTCGPYYVRSTVGHQKQNPRDLRLERYLWRRQTLAFSKWTFPEGNAHHHQRPNLKHLGFLPLASRRLPSRRHVLYRNLKACQQKKPLIARG